MGTREGTSWPGISAVTTVGFLFFFFKQEAYSVALGNLEFTPENTSHILYWWPGVFSPVSATKYFYDLVQRSFSY